MSISTEKTADTFLDIIAATPINCDWPLFAEDEVQVIYGSAAIVAELNVDYTVTLDAPNYNTFTVTPLTALINKINELISEDEEDIEINYVTIRRVLDYETPVETESVRQTAFIKREFERTAMRFQQLAEQIARALLFPASEVGDVEAGLNVLPAKALRANKAVICDEEGNVTVSSEGYEDQAALASGYKDAAEAAAATATAQAATATTKASQAETARAAAVVAQGNAEAAEAATEALRDEVLGDADVSTVAANIADVNAVADNIASVNTVADNEENINAVVAAAAILQLEGMPFRFEVVQDGTEILWQNVPFPGTAKKVTTICASGTVTATVKINSTALGGTANSVSSAENIQTHSTSNTWVAGDDIKITFASNSMAVGVVGTLEYERTV